MARALVVVIETLQPNSYGLSALHSVAGDLALDIPDQPSVAGLEEADLISLQDAIPAPAAMLQI